MGEETEVCRRLFKSILNSKNRGTRAEIVPRLLCLFLMRSVRKKIAADAVSFSKNLHKNAEEKRGSEDIIPVKSIVTREDASGY